MDDDLRKGKQYLLAVYILYVLRRQRVVHVSPSIHLPPFPAIARRYRTGSDELGTLRLRQGRPSGSICLCGQTPDSKLPTELHNPR